MEGRVDCLDRGFDSLDLLGPELAFRHQAPSHESTKARLEVPEYLLDLSLDADHPCIPSLSCHAWCSRRRRVGSESFAPPNGPRLSCGRNAGGRKVAERQKKRLAGERTQFFPQERPPASSAC